MSTSIKDKPNIRVVIGENKPPAAREAAILAGCLEYCRQTAVKPVDPETDTLHMMETGEDLVDMFGQGDVFGANSTLEYVLLEHFELIHGSMFDVDNDSDTTKAVS